MWVHGGGLPLTKQHFDTGDGFQLGVAGGGRQVLEGAGKDGESVGDAVDGGNAHLGKVRVTEFNGIGEH